jgi:hypothetical protein
MKLSLLAVPLLILVGCSSAPEVPKMKMAMGIPDGQIEYKPVNTADLNLRLLSNTDLYAGQKTELVFALSNDGRKTVNIPEWYSNETDNITVSIQPWLTGMKEPDPDSWIELSTELKKPVLHYPLTLMPGNKALISKELGFIENLKVSQGKFRRYFVKAKLNLKSVELQSKVYTLQVFSKQTTGGSSK